MRWNYHTGESKIPNFITMEEYYEKWYKEWLLMTLFKEEEFFVFKIIDGVPMMKLGTIEEMEDGFKKEYIKPSNLCEEIIL